MTEIRKDIPAPYRSRLDVIRSLQVGESVCVPGAQPLVSSTAYRAFGKGNFMVCQGPSSADRLDIPEGYCRVWRTG